MSDNSAEGIQAFERLVPFMRKARVIEIGRQRLEQVRKQLAFVLITTDLAENSRKKALELFPCPVFQCLTSEDLERLFDYRGTKMLGFRKGSLSIGAMKALKEFRLIPVSENQA